MAIIIKNEQEIELIRESCRRLAIVHKELEAYVKPGISTRDIDILGDQLIRKLGGIPNFLHYNGYPASICVSVMMRSYTAFRASTAFYRRATLSALMRE